MPHPTRTSTPRLVGAHAVYIVHHGADCYAEIVDLDGREVARGLIAYSAAHASRILGHKSREIEALLGYRGREELIHRDDLVLTRGRTT